MSFDITTIEQDLASEDAGTIIDLLDQNDEPAFQDDGKSPVTITAAGLNSKRYAKAEAWQTEQYQKAGLRGKKLSPAEQLAIRCGVLARVTLGWSGLSSTGSPLGFSTDNATDVYIRLAFVRKQVEAAVGDRTRFFDKPSST